LKPGVRKKPTKTSVTFSLDQDVMERLRNACYWERLTVSQLMQLAIRDVGEDLETVSRDGRSLKRRTSRR